MRFCCLVVVLCCLACPALAEPSSALLHRLQRLKVLGSVLYVAAHPDDENTALLARLSRQEGYHTAYLSLTRGRGGQNRIGSELGPELAVLRTQELLAARRLDGVEQFFTRAVDFGFSKHPEEALRTWDRQAVSEDIRFVVQQVQPDLIITRFSEEPGVTHGHHTASAILARQAFKTSGARRLLWNVIDKMPGEQTADAQPGDATLDLNGYLPLLGLSIPNLAAQALSQNRSQAFGSAADHGRPPARLRLVEGEPFERNVWEGIDTSWSRLPGGADLELEVQAIIDNFSVAHPDRSVPGLLALRTRLQELAPSVWRSRKMAEVEALIHDCLGLELHASVDSAFLVAGESVPLEIRLLAQTDLPVQWLSLRLPGQAAVPIGRTLARGRAGRWEATLHVPPGTPSTHPAWLESCESLEVTTPEKLPPFSVSVQLKVDQTEVTLNRPVLWKRTDPVEGVLVDPVAVVPAYTLEVDASPLPVPLGEERRIEVSVACRRPLQADARLGLEAPEGWVIKPQAHVLNPLTGHESVTRTFSVRAPREETSRGILHPVLEIGGRRFDRTLTIVDYPHIPRQVLTPRAGRPVVGLKLNGTRVGRVGYLEGAGDTLDESTRLLGYDLVRLSGQESEDQLKTLRAIVLGVRALNTNPALPSLRYELEKYMNKGGTVVLNYNTPHALKTDPFGLSLSPNRVTDQQAPVVFLEPDHPILNHPHRLTGEDFAGWVSERGLSFPEPPFGEFTPVLEMSDPGEEPLRGGLLVRPWGQGRLIVNSLSLFRQLPAGVPGAYRLWVNLLETP